MFDDLRDRYELAVGIAQRCWEDWEESDGEADVEKTEALWLAFEAAERVELMLRDEVTARDGLLSPRVGAYEPPIDHECRFCEQPTWNAGGICRDCLDKGQTVTLFDNLCA